jgi:hypothetical protein
MYFPIDYNCFVNQLYCKTKIVYKKGVTCKKKYANFIFALGDNDLQQYTNNVFLAEFDFDECCPGVNFFVSAQYLKNEMSDLNETWYTHAWW